MSPWLLSSGDHICEKMEEAQRREQQGKPGRIAESPLRQPYLLGILVENENRCINLSFMLASLTLNFCHSSE